MPNSKVHVVKDTKQYDYRPHIAFKLDPNFGKALLDTNVYSSSNAFLGSIGKYFRGFELRAEQTNNAMLSFNVGDDTSGIYIYYKKQNDTSRFSGSW